MSQQPKLAKILGGTLLLHLFCSVIGSASAVAAGTNRLSFVQYYSYKAPYVSLVTDKESIRCPSGASSCELNGVPINVRDRDLRFRLMDIENNIPEIVCHISDLQQNLAENSILLPNSISGTKYSNNIVGHNAMVDAYCDDKVSVEVGSAAAGGYSSSQKPNSSWTHSYICEQGVWKQIGRCSKKCLARSEQFCSGHCSNCSGKTTCTNLSLPDGVEGQVIRDKFQFSVDAGSMCKDDLVQYSYTATCNSEGKWIVTDKIRDWCENK